jgi:hypothetical protein
MDRLPITYRSLYCLHTKAFKERNGLPPSLPEARFVNVATLSKMLVLIQAHELQKEKDDPGRLSNAIMPLSFGHQLCSKPQRVGHRSVGGYDFDSTRDMVAEVLNGVSIFTLSKIFITMFDSEKKHCAIAIVYMNSKYAEINVHYYDFSGQGANDPDAIYNCGAVVNFIMDMARDGYNKQ